MTSLDRISWRACDWLASQPSFTALVFSAIAAVIVMVGLMEGPF